MANKKENTFEIKPEETAAASVGAEPEKHSAPKQDGRNMVKVRIPRTKKDQEDVFVSVNMETFLIKRGMEVEVPDYVAEVLRHQEEVLEEIMQFEDANAEKE